MYGGLSAALQQLVRSDLTLAAPSLRFLPILAVFLEAGFCATFDFARFTPNLPPSRGEFARMSLCQEVQEYAEYRRAGWAVKNTAFSSPTAAPSSPKAKRFCLRWRSYKPWHRPFFTRLAKRCVYNDQVQSATHLFFSTPPFQSSSLP